jgi:hypothetical protein
MFTMFFFYLTKIFILKSLFEVIIEIFHEETHRHYTHIYTNIKKKRISWFGTQDLILGCIKSLHNS